MGLSLYDTTVPVIKLYLNNLIHILNVAESSNQSSDLLSARLVSDMYTLAQQVQCACKAAANIPLLVLDQSITGTRQHESDHQTFDALKVYINDTITFIEGEGEGRLSGAKNFSRDAYDGAEEKQITWLTYQMSGLVYVTHYALPNFFFHVVTAYDILRAQGIALGKGDLALGPANPMRQQKQ